MRTLITYLFIVHVTEQLLILTWQNVSTTWIAFDGPLTASWADNLNSALDEEKVNFMTSNL